MKRLSTVINEARNSKVPEGVAYLTKAQLEEYMKAASNIISSDAKLVISYLINNGTATDETLLDIMKKPGDSEEARQVSAAMKKLAKYNRYKEVPVFQTQEEFDAVINQECTVDELIYDFSSEAGRNEIAKKYEGLVHKIAQGFKNKSNLNYDEILSAAWNGFTEALNKYAKGERIATDEATGKKKWVSFGVFAAQQIRFYILEDIKHLSHTVHIPTSVQAKERQATGKNTKSHTVSGDAVKNDNTGKGGNNKTYFDVMAGEHADSMSFEEVDNLWGSLVDRIREVFGGKRSRDVNVFLDSFGLQRDEPMKDKEVAAKYGIAPSNVTRIKKDIIKFLREDPECKDICAELGGYFNENMKPAPYVKRIVEDTDGVKYNIVCELKGALNWKNLIKLLKTLKK